MLDKSQAIKNVMYKKLITIKENCSLEDAFENLVVQHPTPGASRRAACLLASR